MKKKIFFAALITLSVSIIIFSCKKEEEAEPDTDTQSAIDYTKSEEAVSSTFSTVNHYGINQEEIKSLKGILANPIINVDTIGDAQSNFWPRRLTIDFGSGIVCFDGRTRKGKLFGVFSNHWRPDTIIAGTNAIVTFEDFYVDNIQRLGTFTITYEGNPNGGPKYTVDAANAKLLFSNGDEISWTSTRTTEWIDGYATTLEVSDDVFETTGSVSGVNKKGVSYTGNITTPIRTEKGCLYGVTKGVVEITPNDKSTRTVDYGDGECDNKAKLSINGVSINFVF